MWQFFSDHRHRRIGLWVFVFLSVLYVAVTRGHFISTDEIAMFQTTRSLVERGDLSTGPIINTFQGRYGLFYSVYNAGQAVAALPLFVTGKIARALLEALGCEQCLAILAGPAIGEEPMRWGGDVEIFFVNLFNGFATATLCVVFFLLSRGFGAAVPSAAASALLLGTCTYAAPFATAFMRHTGETLCLLLVLLFLFQDRRHPNRNYRLLAGAAAGVMIHFRLTSSIALPWLCGFALWTAVERSGRTQREWKSILRDLSPFIAPLAAAWLLYFCVSLWKFETVWAVSLYAYEGFETPLWKGLYGFLFSVGESIFLFSPLLALAPWLLRRHWKRDKAETVLLALIAGTYLFVFSCYTKWHGLWWLGPRYLLPLTPLLLLPLAGWIDEQGRRVRLAVAGLAFVGLLVQIPHVAVNYSYVHHYEGYETFQPPEAYLFIPEYAPLLAQTRGLLAQDYRVDMWLVNVYRAFGPLTFLAVAVPLFTLLVFAALQLKKAVVADSGAT